MSEEHPSSSQSAEDPETVLIVWLIIGILERYRSAGIAVVRLASVKAHRKFIRRRKRPNSHGNPDTCAIVAWDAPGWARHELYKARVINWTATELVGIARREVDRQKGAVAVSAPITPERAQPIGQYPPEAIVEFFRVMLR